MERFPTKNRILEVGIMLKLRSYGTNQGLIINQDKGSYFRNLVDDYRFNNLDKDKITRFKNDWLLLEGVHKLETVEVWIEPKDKLVQWNLRDQSLSSATIPPVLLESSVESYVDDGETRWKNRDNIRSLYTPVKKLVDGHYSLIEFEIDHISDVEGDISKPITSTFKILESKDNWKELPIGTITRYSEIDIILVPEFALHMKKCSLTQDDSYKIIRSYVLDHIDNKHARVSSDYDFCFTVQKIVNIYPEPSEFDKTPLSKRPMIKSNTHKQTQFEIYNVAPKPYQSYSVVKPFMGDSMEDLVNNINLFLKELITAINKPHTVCECCNGLGYTK